MRASDILLERFVNLIGTDKRKQQYKQQVYDLLVRSYASIGGIKGHGFASPDEIVNIPFWKLAIKDGKLVAAILYKDKDGRKSVAAGTDGTEQGKSVMISMTTQEASRSYAEKSKAALSMAMKSLTPEQQIEFLVTIDHVRKLVKDDIIPLSTTPKEKWPITDQDEIDSAELTLQRYPQLTPYAYFRKIGDDYKFKVMLGTPKLNII